MEESKIILTNLYVIGNATYVNIKGGDGKIYTPKSVDFVDTTTDLALIQATENDVPKGLSFGNPNKIEEGDKIFVIDNLGGLELSLSEGIISGKGNLDTNTNGYREMMQITAPVSLVAVVVLSLIKK